MIQSELLEIINDLHNGEDLKKGWSYILKKIKKFLNVDGVFFAELLHEDSIRCFNSEDYDPPEYEIESSLAFTTVHSRKPIIINDYSNYRFAQQYWLDKGIKRVASVPVMFDGKVFGALQIISVSEREIKDSDVDVLEALSKIISFVLYYRKKTESSEKVLTLMVKEFEFFYSRKLPDFFDRGSLKRWVVEYLRNIVEITDASLVGFVFPEENIFAVLIKDGDKIIENFYTRLTDEVKGLEHYKIWEKSIGRILSFEILKEWGIEPSSVSKEAGIKSALFVPVKYNREIKVVVGFGYNRKIDIDDDYRLALQNCATHLTFMLLAAKNLSLVNSKLIDVEESFLESFIHLIEARDVYTKGHSLRVAYYAKRIAEALGKPMDEQKRCYIAGLLHDIGKIGIPDSILMKPGKLTPYEFEIVKYHAEFSYQIIKDIESLRDVRDCVRFHHERCDGSGYPKGLKCEDIPLRARILAIADVFDAITTDRPYRKRLSLDDALGFIADMEEELDQSIVERSMEVLSESYTFLKNSFEHRNFLPEEIDLIRRAMFDKDYMTGLLNRRKFLEEVQKIIAQYRRFVMFYFDIKNLSMINHRYSMEVGDKVILSTAEALKKVEGVELLARTEPDAFYFVYEGSTEAGLFVYFIKKLVKDSVVERLEKEEMGLESWKRVIDYYVSYSEFMPGKTAEDMMYECKQAKKEIEELLI